jgi:hypothetical protein
MTENIVFLMIIELRFISFYPENKRPLDSIDMIYVESGGLFF